VPYHEMPKNKIKEEPNYLKQPLSTPTPVMEKKSNPIEQGGADETWETRREKNQHVGG